LADKIINFNFKISMDNEKRIALGQYLFIEGTHYEELKDKAIPIGKHLSIFIHDSCGIISIHFREGLEELNKLNSKPLELMKIFFKNLKTDLNDLAVKLQNDSRLIKINEIWGLCTLSTKWGERHGFETHQFIDDPDLIRAHDKTIIGAPKLDELSIPQPLSLFYHTKESFIKEFGVIKKS